MDLTTGKAVEDHMKAATSAQDWKKRADQVKADNDGKYPDFWFTTIVISGLADDTWSKW